MASESHNVTDNMDRLREDYQRLRFHSFRGVAHSMITLVNSSWSQDTLMNVTDLVRSRQALSVPPTTKNCIGMEYRPTFVDDPSKTEMDSIAGFTQQLQEFDKTVRSEVKRLRPEMLRVLYDNFYDPDELSRRSITVSVEFIACHEQA
jgi:hypothetical protein